MSRPSAHLSTRCGSASSTHDPDGLGISVVTDRGREPLAPYLWNSATWENSEALLPFVEPVLTGPDAWDASETLRRAIEIRAGRVCNPAILAFQGRSAEHPYPMT